MPRADLDPHATPSKPLTEFRIDSKGRVNNVRVAIVID